MRLNIVRWHTIILLIVTSITTSGQGFLKVGFGMGYAQFTGNGYLIDTITIRPDNRRDESRLIFSVAYRHLITKKIDIEVGLTIKTTFYTYYAGQEFPPFGILEKVGFVQSRVFNVPINIGYNIKKWCYMKGGLSTSFAKLNLQPDYYFNDMPGVNEIYNQTKHIFKPVFFNYGFGFGFRFWRLDLSYYHAQSFTDISDPLYYHGETYYVFTGMKTNQIELAYLINLNRKKSK